MAEVSPLEGRFLLARAAADPLMPGNTVTSAGDVLYYDANVPLKEISFTKNTSQTVYPILSDADSRTAPGPDVPIFDPFDPVNQ